MHFKIALVFDGSIVRSDLSKICHTSSKITIYPPSPGYSVPATIESEASQLKRYEALRIP